MDVLLEVKNESFVQPKQIMNGINERSFCGGGRKMDRDKSNKEG